MIALHAECIATADDEQAVSKVIDGPVHPNQWLIFPLKKALKLPRDEYAFGG